MKYRYRESHEMKDSGVEWLGMIPKEWEVSKFKYFFKFGMGETILKEDLDGEGIPIFSATEENKYFGYIKFSRVDLKKGDIVIPARGNSIGAVKLVTERSTCTQTTIYCKKNSKKIIEKFIYYYMQGKRKKLFYFDQTAIPQITIAQVSENSLINMKTTEQQKIADFLDKKCEEFDSVIAKKEMLINKLEEAKKSLISEVVTGKVKVIQKENGEYRIIKREAHELKDSGVEWLGMIPKEWEVSKMKNKLIKFTDGAHISPEVENGVYPFLSVKDLKNGFLDFKNCLKTSIESYKYLKRNSCKPERGDLLISKDGTIGKTCLIDFDKEFVVASSLVIIKSNKNFSIKFLDYILQSEASQKQIFQYVKGAALPRISLELLKNIYIPFINQQDEQIKINNLLDKKCSQFDIAIEKQKEIIEKLKLAKQSLISEAVTGKIEIL